MKVAFIFLSLTFAFLQAAQAMTPIHMHLSGKYTKDAQTLADGEATSHDINGLNGTNFTFIDVENDLKTGCSGKLMKTAVKTMAASHNYPAVVEIDSLIMEQGRLGITWVTQKPEQACTYKWSDARQDYCWNDSCLK
jgi:hypothetical protein